MTPLHQNAAVRRLETVSDVETIVGRPAPMIMLKQLTALDEGCRTVLAHSPIAALGYRDRDGTSRTTFVGGTPGFARALSSTRIAFTLPARGEPHGGLSLFFLLPGVGETLRVNGTAAGSKGTQTLVDVTEAYVHCAQAVLRSGLWKPPTNPATPGVPIEGDDPLSGPGVADFLAAAPFLALSSWDADGGSDTSPRGDQQAVARILDGRTLAIADRKGNKRADTLHNLLQDDRISLAALVPGRSGVLHIRGRAAITDDPALLETMALRGMSPHLALLVDVEHAEITGSDALVRSRLWNPGARPDVATLPDMMALGSAHLAAGAADADGGPPAFLLKAVGAIPGLSRLMRWGVNRSYRSRLRKEGYADIQTGTHKQPSGTRLQTAADGDRSQPLREVHIVDVRRETPSAITLVLEDTGPQPQPFDFRPGQYFTLITDIDGRPARRAYSASSAPGSARLEITVKHVDGGRFSTHVHHSLHVHDRLTVRGPSGSFHAQLPCPVETVMIAAGSGVTPMMSMIRTRLADSSGRDTIALLYTSRSTEEIIFGDELDRLVKDFPGRLSVTHVLTRTDGRLDADGVRSWLTHQTPAQDAHYYLCGPEPLMNTVQGVLAGLKVPGGQVYQERFTSGLDLTDATTTPQVMTVEENGRPLGTVTVEPGQTLLEAGLAAGLAMPHSCTVGNCGDCMVKLNSGDVTQSEPNCLTRQQKADGYVLACMGCPLSKITVDIAEP